MYFPLYAKYVQILQQTVIKKVQWLFIYKNI